MYPSVSARWIRLGCVIGLFVSDPVSAQYVRNYAQWQALNSEARFGYGMGLFDGASEFSLAPLRESAWNLGLMACSHATSLTATMIVDLIDRYYTQHVGDWDRSPHFIFRGAMFPLCKDYINNILRAGGERPFDEFPSTRR
jgi:hypothetical protein